TAQATSTVQTISGGKTGYRAATATPVPGTALPVPKTSPRQRKHAHLQSEDKKRFYNHFSTPKALDINLSNSIRVD
ncbi:hypothetical protein MHX62_11800, partial [Corynebacterium sp. ACRQM]|uniref:hypothetical protein n=1 Tax=unclassified Corynebacterium TaxID=2624378 RepID=UPI001EF66AD5